MTRSTMITSNSSLEDQGKRLGDALSAAASLDQGLHHADPVQMTGRKISPAPYRRPRGSLPPPDPASLPPFPSLKQNKEIWKPLAY